MEDQGEESIGAWPFDGRRSPPHVYQRGRRCAEAGCDTILSIYNSGRYCADHEADAAMSRRRRKVS